MCATNCSSHTRRFPNKYYIHEARRIRRLFGDVGTIFICSDRKHAIDRMIDQYGDEFEFLVQPRVQGALPMHYVHTDLALLGQADYLIMTVSIGFRVQGSGFRCILIWFSWDS